MGHGPLIKYVKLRIAHAPGMSETFSPHPLQRKPLVSEPGMHHGTCVTHVPWCMSGSLMAGKTFPAFPDHAQPAILRIWQEAHASPKLVIPLVCMIHGFYDALVLRPRGGKGVTRFVRPIGPTIHRSYGPLARQLLGLPYKPRLVIPLVGTTHSSHNLLVPRPISPGHKAMKVNIVSWLSGVPDYFGRNKISSGGICPIIQVPHCIRVFFYFVWFVFINHIFQFYYELCTYCNILDICLS